MHIFYVNEKEICAQGSYPNEKQEQIYKLNTNETIIIQINSTNLK